MISALKKHGNTVTTSYESSLKQKQTQVIVTPMAATPGSKHCAIISIFLRHLSN